MLWTLSIIIIATILIALFIYYNYYHKVEKFTGPVNIQDAVDGLTQLLAAVGSGNIPEGSPYVETLSGVPSTLDFYLTSFSQRTKYDNSVKVYLPEMQRWYNFIKANQSFFVKGDQANLTAPIYRTSDTGGGMRLKNVALEGLRSDELNITDYSLKSFSATFFMTFATAQQIPTGGYELFTISLEAPNYSRLTLKKDSDTHCKLELQIGETTNVITTDPISKATLMTANPVAITITCTIVGSEITANIFITKTTVSGNTTDITTITAITATEPNINLVTGNKLILGNSRISINKKQDPLDANLLAFMFFSEPLASGKHDEVTRYLATQNRAETGILSTLNTDATAQLQNIRNLIATNTATQGTLQEQLNACKATIAATPVVHAFGHKITMNGISSVSTEDLRACSVLEVKNRLTNAVAAASGTTDSGYARKINMPPNTPESTTPIAP